MTQEEKAKAYDEALEIAKQIINNNSTEVEKLCLECVFPELKESEEERINRAIFKALSKKDARDVLLAEGIQVSDALAYLEKQGQQRPKQDWSEEDEVMFRTARKIIFESDDCSEGTSYKVIDWLKSLKPQYHWKPEGQQLCCLRHMIDVSTVDKIDRQIVIDLYEQLKSL